MKATIADGLFILGVVALAVMLVLALTGAVEAAPSDPDVPECEPINTAAAIVVYRCLPNEGPSYLLNSFGFMVVED